ncbi:hypothetical protein K7W03_25745 [Sphingobium sp. PNB]|uniref:hypothetical protein n=1 Tax=Sphingobium sp. PNB TaxID=863934 RepID=UPI001CA3C55F|nr:hypothetical protein [Sphingobium sp. PNB]MCB4862989.1 hypothetical protein [Sphingobium sp. PNB]
MSKEAPRHRLVTEILRKAGGIDVESILPRVPKKRRADIFFKDHEIIVEVKEITNDRLSDPKVLQSLNDLITIDGPSMGGPVIFGTVRLRADTLPNALARKYFQRVGKRVQKEVSEANGQIRDTKEALGLPDARGLLVLISRPMKMNLRVMGWAVHDELTKNQHPHINGLMMAECETETAIETGNSYISFHSRELNGLPDQLKVQIANAWGEVTSQRLAVATEADFDRRYP